MEGLYLQDIFTDTAVFPNKTTGRFTASQIRPLNNYEVCREDKEAEAKAELPVSASTGPSSFSGPSTSSSFASASSGYSFTRPTLSLSLKKRNVIRKTISLIRLEKGRDKKVSFVPITDIIIKMNGQDDCTVIRVAELVKDEVGFDVTLVNTKCNQIVESDATRGLDFWKSSRKVLAVHSQMFDKVYGKKKAYSAAIDLTQDEDDYDTEEDEAEGPTPPLAKRRKTNEKQNNELQGIHQALIKIQQMIRPDGALRRVQSIFECVICRSVMDTPLFSPCCNRMLGCSACLHNWFAHSPTCPHCKQAVTATEWLEVKGLQEIEDVRASVEN